MSEKQRCIENRQASEDAKARVDQVSALVEEVRADYEASISKFGTDA